MIALRSRELSGGFTETFLDAIRYWEPRRLPYNLALAAVFATWVAFVPHFGPITQQGLLALMALALLANACYSAAYAVDLALQYSSRHDLWRRRGRWMLWSAGTLFALVLEFYWIADEIYS